MIREPASKEWFVKHGTPKSNALHHASGKVPKKAVRMLSEVERKEKTKNWPSAGEHKVDHVEYQKRFKRAYND